MTIKSVKLGQLFSVGHYSYVKCGTYKVYSIDQRKVFRISTAALNQTIKQGS